MSSTPSPITTQEQQISSRHERLYTAIDLRNLSTDAPCRYELKQGRLITTPLAGYEHGNLTMALGAPIHLFADANDLGSTFAAGTGFTLEENPDTVRAPDIAFVRKDRLPNAKLPQGYFPGAPDLAVEVVSPNDSASRVLDKVQDWLRHGTMLVWVVEPQTQTVTIYRADGSATVLQSDDTLTGEEVLPGFRYELKTLFT
jgi:Uma2 family endonuclease